MKKLLRIVFSPVTLILAIGLGAIAGAIGLVSYWYYFTFKNDLLWKKVLQTK